LRSEVDKLNSEVNNLQINLKNFEYQKNDLEKRLFEFFLKDYEEVKNDFNKIEMYDVDCRYFLWCYNEGTWCFYVFI
jgi:chaperonin cofactor prefoldin